MSEAETRFDMKAGLHEVDSLRFKILSPSSKISHSAAIILKRQCFIGFSFK
jgi:hypothetical protein